MSIQANRTCSSGAYDFAYVLTYEKPHGITDECIMRFLPAETQEQADAFGEKLSALVEQELGVKVLGVRVTMAASSVAVKRHRDEVEAMQKNPSNERRLIRRAGGAEFVRF